MTRLFFEHPSWLGSVSKPAQVVDLDRLEALVKRHRAAAAAVTDGIPSGPVRVGGLFSVSAEALRNALAARGTR